jgi:hypothetical protein
MPMQVAAAYAEGLHPDNDLVSILRRIGKRHQFQPAVAGENNAAHRLLRLFLVGGPIVDTKNVIGKVRTVSRLA